MKTIIRYMARVVPLFYSETICLFIYSHVKVERIHVSANINHRFLFCFVALSNCFLNLNHNFEIYFTNSTTHSMLNA